MIYVVTVHWRSAKWIAPQIAYLERNIRSPFRVFATLNEIDPSVPTDHFYHADSESGPHGEKLNALAQKVAKVADPSDTLIFLDSDAFPVRPLDRWLDEQLADHPLVAVQRRENLGDLRPHPSFCATTVGFWDSLDGDWSRAPWTTPSGTLFDDSGTGVYRALEAAHTNWLPLLRSNTNDAHPLWYGVYGHYVYHHGGGSRTPWSTFDKSEVFAKSKMRDPSLRSLAQDVARDPGSLRRIRGSTLKTATVRSFRQVQMRLRLRSIERESDRIFDRLSTDPTFYLEFDDTLMVAP